MEQYPSTINSAALTFSSTSFIAKYSICSAGDDMVIAEILMDVFSGRIFCAKD